MIETRDNEDEQEWKWLPSLVRGTFDGSFIGLVVGLVIGSFWGVTLSMGLVALTGSVLVYLIGAALDGLLRTLLGWL